MSHRLNPISPLKGCGINRAIAHQGSPIWCQHPLALASSPRLGWAGAAPALAFCRHRTEPAPPAWHRLGQTQTLLLISVLGFAKLLRKLAQNYGCCLLFLPEQGSDVLPSFPKVLCP